MDPMRGQDPKRVDEKNLSPHELTFPASSWLMLCSKLLKTGHLGKGDRAAAKLALGVGLVGLDTADAGELRLAKLEDGDGLPGMAKRPRCEDGQDANNNGSSMAKCLRGI